MTQKYDPNTLWVALSEYADGNVFGVYPKILAQLLLEEEAARQPGDTSEAEKLILPSDKEWRLQQYFYLVGLQKDLESELSEEELKRDVKSEDQVEEWSPWNAVVSVKNPHAPPPVAVTTSPGPAWDINQVLKAARLLFKPPITVSFEDEQEMRCVYSLIYDVFRYKSILDQAIDDIEFFENFPELSIHRNIVWLFLMELARRRWAARPRNEVEVANKLLRQTGEPFQTIERTIWEQRVHFAAAVARIRIKNRAFSLSELLPPHLREERISACVNKDSVTGWVNTFKAKKVAALVKRLHELGFSYSGSKQLCAGEYRFDRVCPRFITLRPPADTGIGQLDLVKNGVIVLQEREFCEGASTLCRALRVNALRGVVAQTHASSPRCSAYLAAQLRDLAAALRANTPPAPATPDLGKLVVFGAGDKVKSYVGALRELGIEASEAAHSDASVCVLSDAVHCDNPTVMGALEGVVAALATPPNSYSAVTDPIDLVCGRGGDLAMLEILTEAEINQDGKARVQSILEEQKKTLKALLSKPQIQLVLYETHSALEAENQAQVTRAVAEANRLARERHAFLKKRNHHCPKTRPATARTDSSTTLTNGDLSDRSDPKSSNANSRPASAATTVLTRPASGETVLTKNAESKVSGSRPGTNKARPIPETMEDVESVPRDPDDDFADVIVPHCDLFEVRKLPHLGNGLDINYILDRDGCYLSLIQRKEMTRLDAKYMIRVAEERGLFGGTAPAKVKRKEPVVAAPKRRRRKNSFEVGRVSAPTHASLLRSRRMSAPEGVEDAAEVLHAVCSKHARRQAAAATAVACTCDARHRYQRRASADVTAVQVINLNCRQPFPLFVYDLRLPASQKNTSHLEFICGHNTDTKI